MHAPASNSLDWIRGASPGAPIALTLIATAAGNTAINDQAKTVNKSEEKKGMPEGANDAIHAKGSFAEKNAYSINQR